MILYNVNNATKQMQITGPHIAVQTWPECPGSLGARVTVHTVQGGPILRSLHITTAYVIDRQTDDPDPDVIR